LATLARAMMQSNVDHRRKASRRRRPRLAVHRGTPVYWLILTAVLVLITGCTSARFPLCPAVAEASYSEHTRGKIINYYVDQAAIERHVYIEPLSEFSADFYGSYQDIKWFSDNYPFMLCAFDPRKIPDDRETYISCMTHAKDWITILRSSMPENLMLTNTKFKENCSSLEP
jgi:hypothetical protein